MHPVDVGYLIKCINGKIRAQADAELKEQGLTLAQGRVLAYLSHHGGQATQKEIEDFLRVAHPTAVGLVSRLAHNGFVETWVDPKNRRNKLVRATPLAQETGARIERGIPVREAVMLRGLTPEEAEQLRRLLLTVYQNLCALDTAGSSERSW